MDRSGERVHSQVVSLIEWTNNGGSVEQLSQNASQTTFLDLFVCLGEVMQPELPVISLSSGSGRKYCAKRLQYGTRLSGGLVRRERCLSSTPKCHIERATDR